MVFLLVGLDSHFLNDSEADLLDALSSLAYLQLLDEAVIAVLDHVFVAAGAGLLGHSGPPSAVLHDAFQHPQVLFRRPGSLS